MNFGSTLHGFCFFLRPGIPDSLTKFSRIPDSTSNNFPDSGIRIPLHEVTIMLFRKTIITKYTVYLLYFFPLFSGGGGGGRGGMEVYSHEVETKEK